MRIRFAALGGLLLLSAQLWAQVPSPKELLGFELGEKFSWHHQVVSYFEAVAEASPKVELQAYGESYEGRPLMVAFLSSEENLAKLEAIRHNNLIEAGLATGEVEGPRLPIVWLSYNIHGNEAVSTEAAMATLHRLATHETAEEWLQNLVVVIDPCLNPDGRDRYVNWYKQVRHDPAQVEPASLEHREPWPGGRLNHYLYDLNRDWAWQTQQESRQRGQLYQRWMPQVHVDFHEMGAEDPYFFAPAADPMHEVINDWQKEFQELVGKNHAQYFDTQGWLFFTKEVFDLFYPSYGDTWPTYQGAIGFTYEQGGSSRAGLGYLRQTGDTLTLKERIAHHYTTSLSTIETSHRHRVRLLDEYDQYFESARQGNTTFKTYWISQNNAAGKLSQLTDLLDQHQIRFESVGKAETRQGFHYGSNVERSISLEVGDLLIPSAQSQGNLVKVLFEPQPLLKDSLTYDLTAWALPYAYNLEAAAFKMAIRGKEPNPKKFVPAPLVSGSTYAYLVPWEDMRSARWLAAMQQAGLQVRMTEVTVRIADQSFAPGSLVATQADNPGKGLDKIAVRLANQFQIPITASPTGFSQAGVDLGSESVRHLAQPKIALVRGDGVSASRFGELWFFFEQELHYPL
ncbi:MAG: M14 metallopeptidase family protein, partial [Bacteroidota bacterium]